MHIKHNNANANTHLQMAVLAIITTIQRSTSKKQQMIIKDYNIWLRTTYRIQAASNTTDSYPSARIWQTTSKNPWCRNNYRMIDGLTLLRKTVRSFVTESSWNAWFKTVKVEGGILRLRGKGKEGKRERKGVGERKREWVGERKREGERWRESRKRDGERKGNETRKKAESKRQGWGRERDKEVEGEYKARHSFTPPHHHIMDNSSYWTISS